MRQTSSRASIRASDADRDRVAERLRHAATEGRLLTEELEQRLESALSARTYGQLEALLADLPGPRLLARRPARRRRRPLQLLPMALGLAVLVPLALALAAVVLQLALGAIAVWWLWLAAGWVFFGRRRSWRGPWGGWPRRHGPIGRRRIGYQNRSWTNWA